MVCGVYVLCVACMCVWCDMYVVCGVYVLCVVYMYVYVCVCVCVCVVCMCACICVCRPISFPEDPMLVQLGV
jgi:hypothetical protein